jgi:ABC-2 type transport system permease protein
VIRAEWAKLRTARSTYWLLAAAVALAVGIGAAAAGTVVCPPRGCTVDGTNLSLTGIVLGQAVVAILAVLALGGERGMLATTFAAMPRRMGVLAAKTIVVGALVAAAGSVGVLGALFAGRLAMPDRVRTVTGDGVLSLADAPVRRAVIGSILYLILVAWLSLGVSALVREPAAAIGITLGLFYILPTVATVVSDPNVRKWLDRVSPASAGSSIRATAGFEDLPIGPWRGLAVVAAWAVAALIIGGIALHRRDA